MRVVLAIALSAAALCSCASQRTTDVELCAVLGALRQMPQGGEAPAFPDPYAATLNRKIDCGFVSYNYPHSTTVIQSVVFTDDHAYALVLASFGNGFRLVGGDRYVLRRTDRGWLLMSREQEWEY